MYKLKREVMKKIIKKEASMFVLIPIVALLLFFIVKNNLGKPVEFLLIILLILLVIVLFQRFEFIMNLLSENYCLYDCRFIDAHSHSVGDSRRVDVLVEFDGEIKKIPIRPSTTRFFRGAGTVLVVISHNKEFAYAYKMFNKDSFKDVIEKI